MRNGKSAHGGVLIGIRNSYQFEQVYIASTEDLLSSSYVCVSVFLRDCKLLVCCVYNPPKDSPYRLSTDSIKHFLSTVCTLESFNHVLITGDWNLPKTDWSLYSSTDDYEDEITRHIDSLMLRQLVTEPTCGSTTLDLVLIKSPHHTDDVLIDESFEKSFPLSDHRPVKSTWLCSGTPTANERRSKTYSFTSCDYDDAKNMIFETPSSPICYSNINKMVGEWYDLIFKIIDAYVPVRSNHRAQLSPWVTGRTSNVLKKLSTAEKHKKSDPKIPSLRNEAALYLDEDRVEYETKLFLEETLDQFSNT